MQELKTIESSSGVMIATPPSNNIMHNTYAAVAFSFSSQFLYVYHTIY